MEPGHRSFYTQQRYNFQPHFPIECTTLADINEQPASVFRHDFSGRYRSLLDTSWVPTRTSRPDPPLMMKPTEIYNRAIGQLPGYSGHIPGETTRFGHTFGFDTRDAKRHIRGD